MKTGNFHIGQWKALIWSARVSATLSILGSSTIIFMILRRRKVRLALMHNRLLLGMSCIDIINSISLWIGPAATSSANQSDVWGAIGTDGTCSAQGFFFTLGLGVPMYNAMLCLYYSAVIRYEWKQEEIQKYEKYMHITAICIPLTGAIIFVMLDTFRNTGFYCWMPRNNGDEGDSHDVGRIGIVVALTIACFVLLTIIITMGGVYCKVREQSAVMDRYSSFQRETRISSNGIFGRRNSNVTSSKQADDTGFQAFLYVVAFISTYLAITVHNIIDDTSFGLTLCIAITFPLQGFWNMINFVRPKYIAIQQKNMSQSFLWLVKASIFSSLEEEETKKRLSAMITRRNSLVSRRRRRSRSSEVMRLQGQNSNSRQSNVKSDNPLDKGASLVCSNSVNEFTIHDVNDGISDEECNIPVGDHEGDDVVLRATSMVESPLSQDQEVHADDYNLNIADGSEGYENIFKNRTSSTTEAEEEPAGIQNLSPFTTSLTDLIAQDSLLDHTMMIRDDSIDLRKRECSEGKKARRRSLPSMYFGMPTTYEYSLTGVGILKGNNEMMKDPGNGRSENK